MCMFPGEVSDDEDRHQSSSRKSANRNSWTKMFSSKDASSKKLPKEARRPDSGGYFSVYRGMARPGHVHQRGSPPRTNRTARARPSQARDSSSSRADRDAQARTNQSLSDASRLENNRNSGKYATQQESTDDIEAIRARALAKAHAQRASDPSSPPPAPALAEPPSDWRLDGRAFVPELVPAPLRIDKEQQKQQQRSTSRPPTSGRVSPGPSPPRPLPRPPRAVPQGPRPQPDARPHSRSSYSSSHHQYGQMPHRQSTLDRIEAAAASHPDVLRRQQRQGSSRKTPPRSHTGGML